ncbi:nucleotidyltransferase family protein [Micromonospora chalcea]|uniref:nucleotidyltransferase family protein n=1 Tax=Micromonospora chalcea TaxID=1874 RepID=UPI0016574C90|nr:nucleotidyltransferase family protein [Micromonospora chalcea]MBC8991779.1 nucleotidyltransferase family protein [Micromonospora chalcea]MCT2279777.1 nucleotidyltransferase family protein [Micromonospora chalcea]
MTPAPATFFPDTTGCPRAYRLLRAACEPPGTATDVRLVDEDIRPLGELLEYAIVAKMLCLFADWLDRHGHTTGLARPMQQFLRAQRRLNTHRWRMHHREAARVITILAGCGVPAAAINGIAHASLLYHADGSRQSSDVDILIPAEAADDAVNVLTRCGYYATGRRTTALHRDFDDPLVPGLTLDLSTRLAHTSEPADIASVLARRTPAPQHAADLEPLPILSRNDGFLHTLARVAAQRRWPALADALRYSAHPTTTTAVAVVPASAQTGWQLLRSYWPQLPERPPLSEADIGDAGGITTRRPELGGRP